MGHHTIEGTVTAVAGGRYEVQTETGVYSCLVRGRLKKELVRPESRNRRPVTQAVRQLRVTSVVAVGDRVELTPLSPTTGVIQRVLPHESRLVRRAAGRKPLAQTVLAGVDQVIAVLAARDPKPDFGILDRLLVVAELCELSAAICLNKIDLGIDEALADYMRMYERIGYRVLYTSTRTGEGIDELRLQLQDAVSAFVGLSGVGKSSIVNALVPDANQKVDEVSRTTGRGRHTTRGARLLSLGGTTNGKIADTPGLREFAFWEIEPESLAWGFVEFRPYLDRCRFADCSHLHEPGCAVREAVDSGIDHRRYRSYVALRTESTN